MQLSKRLTPLFQLIVCIGMFLLLAYAQKLHDMFLPDFETRLPAVTRNLMPEKLLPYVHFGFKNIMADYYWLSAIQDLSVWDHKDIFYLNYFKNIATLDPKFEQPYLFNILVVPQNKDVKMLDEIAKISKVGIDSIPTSWKIPYYLGTQYYMFTRQFVPAVDYIGIAAKRDGGPDGLYLVYNSLLTKKPFGDKETYKTSQKLIEVIYNNTDNETIKKIAEKGIQESIINQMFEKAILAYKTENKKYPKSLNDLIAYNLVRVPKEFSDNFDLVINQSSGSFKIVEQKK